MTDDNVTHLPEPGVVLDLDAEEREAKDIRPPFVTKVGGRNVTFLDPADIDWRDLATVRIPADLINVALQAEDLTHLRSLSLPAWKFNRLLERYYEHYDLEEKLRNARRQAQFNGGL